MEERELWKWFKGLSREERDRVTTKPVNEKEEEIHGLYWKSVNDSIDQEKMDRHGVGHSPHYREPEEQRRLYASLEE